MKRPLLRVLIMLVVVAAVGASYAAKGRRRRTTTASPHSTPQLDFDEVNVVQFDRNRWKEDSTNEDEDGEKEADESARSYFVFESNGYRNNWLSSIFDDDFGMNDERKDEDRNGFFSSSPFYTSLFPNSAILDSNFNSLPSPSSFGPNMCHERKAEQVRSRTPYNGIMSTSCSFINGDFQCNQSSTRNGVTRREINTWSCCEGFSKDPLARGCPIVEKESNLQCLEHKNMTEFITALNTFLLNTYLNEDSSHTILAPDDHALKEYEKELDQHTGNVLEITPEMEQAAEHIKDRLLSHILPDQVSITDFAISKKVDTVLNGSHVFFYRHSVHRDSLSELDVSVNCKPLEPVYMNSKHGRVYTLKGFLNTLNATFKQILEKKSNAKEFLKLASLLNASDVSAAGQTILVPTDQAFETLGDWARERINSKPLDFVKSRKFEYPLCPHRFDHLTAIKSCCGDFINVTKEGNVVKFNDAVLQGEETISKEGAIIYFVDSFPDANKMKSPSELAKTLELNKFVEIMKSANFQETRDEPYSIVAIQDEALEGLDDEAKTKMLAFHTLRSAAKESGPIETEDETSVYLKKFLLKGKVRKLIQCVPLQEHKSPLGYFLFVAQKRLPRNEGTLLDILKNDAKFSTFLELVKLAELEELLENSSHRLTLLAVDNEAFENLTPSSLRRLKRNKAYAKSAIQSHIITTDFCTNDPADEFIVSVPTYGHRQLRWVAERGVVKVVGKALKRDQSDRMATNGVLHVVEDLLQPDFSPTFYFTFFDI